MANPDQFMNSSFLLSSANTALPNATVTTALPAIPSGTGPFSLQTSINTGSNVASWNCRRPYFTRGITGPSSSTISSYPCPGTSGVASPTMITDQIFSSSPYSVVSSNAILTSGVVEYNDPGFSAAALTAGTGYYWSRYLISGSATTFQGNNMLNTMGWCSVKDLAGATLSSGWWNPNVPYMDMWHGAASNSTQMVHECNASNTNVDVTGSNVPVTLNGIIMSVGFSLNSSSVFKSTVWFHTASTNVQICTASITTTVTGMTASTNIVPTFVWGNFVGQNAAITNATAQVMTAGYPTSATDSSLSGFTYFYAR